MIKKIIFLFTIYFLKNLSVFSQDPSFFVIGAEEFSNVNVYSLFYDDNSDIIYAGTNRGVYYYAQNKFTPIISSKDQIGNSFFKLKKNNNGDLFCCNLHGQIFKIQDNKLILYYETPIGDKTIDFDFLFDKVNDFYVFTVESIKKVSSVNKESHILIDSKIINEQLGTIDKKYIFYNTSLINGTIFSRISGTFNYFSYRDGNLKIQKIKDEKVQSKNFFFSLQNIKFYSSETGIFQIGSSNNYPSIPVYGNSIIYKKDKDNVIVLNPDNGMFKLTLEDDSLVASPQFFKDKFISSFTSNANNTAFLGTFKKGIIVVPNWNIVKYKNQYALEGITSSEQNEVYLSNNSNVLFFHDNGPKMIRKYNYNVKNLNTLKQFYTVNGLQMDKIIYYPKEINTDGLKYSNLKDFDENEGHFFFYIDPEHIYIITKDNLFVDSEFADKKGENLYTIKLNKRGRSVSYNKIKKQLNYSTSKGVYLKQWNSAKIDSVLFNGQHIQGNDLTQYKNQLIIGSEKNGILIFNDTILIKQINSINGLKANSVLKIVAKNELLIILTTKGLQVYNLKTNHFIGLGEQEGVIAEKIINFSLSKDKLWLLDQQGYFSYELNKLVIEDVIVLGEIYMDSIIVNNENTPSIENKHLTYDQNDIQFFFDYRDIETKTEARFKYKLIGVSDDWKSIETLTNTLAFPSLSPGEYSFLIKAVYRGSETRTILYKFRIKQPFWFQLWFIALTFFAIILIVSMFFFSKIKRNTISKKIELEQQKLQSDVFESKLKAIQSQMNPHFIFNSLNSIQALVLKQETQKSYDYIEMFSDLVRKTLSYSDENFISMSEEVEFLKIYLTLETLRMKKEFKFSINNSIDDELMIPPLLIQPFLENAIHHGLLHKTGNKNLSISFSFDTNTAFCTIIDDGIGRVKAKEIKDRQKYRHDSFSLAATEERLRILSEQNKKEFNYIIEDLYSDKDMPIGTKVIVSFPFQNKY